MVATIVNNLITYLYQYIKNKLSILYMFLQFTSKSIQTLSKSTNSIITGLFFSKPKNSLSGIASFYMEIAFAQRFFNPLCQPTCQSVQLPLHTFFAHVHLNNLEVMVFQSSSIALAVHTLIPRRGLVVVLLNQQRERYWHNF